MIDKYYLDLVVNEVRNFKRLQKQWSYDDLNDLICHYIEEGVIFSRDDLIKAPNILKTKLGVVLKAEIFSDWWTDKKQYSMIKK